MFFESLNKHQKRIAASSILVLGIVQISLDSWTLYKIQQHEELTIFLSGNLIPKEVMHDMTYSQALSYFLKLKGFLKQDLLEILDALKMTTVLGLVAGILQVFSSTAAVMWKGLSVDISWLVVNFIVSVLLSVAVSYIGIYMIRDVLYHQVLLTVTSVNLFLLVHIWIINLLAVIKATCTNNASKTPDAQSPTSSMENMTSGSSRRTSRNSERSRVENVRSAPTTQRRS